MGNYILGSGTLSSRLGDRIRQKEGLSYGVSSSFDGIILGQARHVKHNRDLQSAEHEPR